MSEILFPVFFGLLGGQKMSDDIDDKIRKCSFDILQLLEGKHFTVIESIAILELAKVYCIREYMDVIR